MWSTFIQLYSYVFDFLKGCLVNLLNATTYAIAPHQCFTSNDIKMSLPLNNVVNSHHRDLYFGFIKIKLLLLCCVHTVIWKMYFSLWHNIY